jgi:hypothetical protein
VIRFQCACGKRLKVEPAHAGCVVECTACGRKMRAPGDPAQPLDGPEALAAAVRAFNARGRGAAAQDADEPTPTDHAAAGLAALAGVPQASPRARSTRSGPARDSRRARTSPKTPVRPIDLLAKRHPSVRSNHRPLLIAAGIAAGALVLAFVVLAISANLGRTGPPPSPAPEPQPVVRVPPPEPPVPASQPGELFPNVAAEKPSASALGSPEPPK